VIAARQGHSGRVRIGFAGPSAHLAVGQLARAVRQEHGFARTPAEVASRCVARDRWVVAVPSDHRLAGAGQVRFADLRDEPFVAFPESFGSAVRSVFVERCQVAGFTPVFVQTAPDSWSSIALVSAGVGMHFTKASAVTHLPLDGVAICQIADDLPSIQVDLVWRHDDDPALHRVLRISHEVLPDAV
jgi:DNA-binding transcriptional LysR family regulator